MIRRWPRAVSNVLAAGLIWLVRLYQATLSPWLGRQCRFVPTCSEYFVDAVRKFGPWKGMLLGLWRVLRCNPFCKGGYDPAGGGGRSTGG